MFKPTNTKTDELITKICDWKIYATTNREYYYLVDDEYVILIIGEMHLEIFRFILTCGIRKIVYLIDENTESLSFSLSTKETLIFSNAEVEPTLVAALACHNSGITIMTPTTLHQSGHPPTSAHSHPSGKCFDTRRNSETDTGE